MKLRYDCMERTQHYYISNSDFMLNYTPYEYDDITGRYYFLEPSLVRSRHGEYVRRRISKADYEQALAACKELCSPAPDAGNQAAIVTTHESLGKAEALHTAWRNTLLLMAEGEEPPLPEISVADMIQDRMEALERQINSRRHPGVTEIMAAHQLYGYKLALYDMGLLEKWECTLSHEPFNPAPDGFRSLPPGLNRDWAQRVYNLGRRMERDQSLPDDDCIVFRNIFRMARELDEQAWNLYGWARDIVKMELRKNCLQLGKMYQLNSAIKRYRRMYEQKTPAERAPICKDCLCQEFIQALQEIGKSVEEPH